MKLADAHLSVFSTTHFDALRFGVPSFTLYEEAYGDYVREIEASGVAPRLPEDGNPFGLSEGVFPLQERKSYFYEDLSAHAAMLNALAG